MHPALDSLFLALQAPYQDLLVKKNQRIVFLRAELHPDMAQVFDGQELICEQPFRTDYNLISKAGFNIVPNLEDTEPADIVICMATRNRDENNYNIARGMSLLRQGGNLIAAQYNTLGAKHLEKDIKALTGDISTFSKKHSRVIQATKNEDINVSCLQSYLEQGKAKKVQGTSLYTKPGMFSWQKVDTGSQILADIIEQTDLNGKGADFGSGWGFLAHRALKLSPRIDELYLYEADKNALNISIKNLSSIKTKIVPCWIDLIQEPITEKFDFILCNPPQHDVTTQSGTLPLKMLEIAANSLVDGGLLWVVTNKQIPVEDILEANFKEVEDMVEDKHYKIFKAIK